MTVSEYREREKVLEGRREYVNGTLFEREDATRRHGSIVLNVVEELDDAAQSRGCELHFCAVLTRTGQTRFRYPDVVASSDPGNDEYMIENPCFITEVTSATTAEMDHMRKLEEYLSLPSLERYAIISQTSRFVVVFRRENGLRTFETFDGSGEFEIPCLGVSLSLDQIYANLEI
jgi:Uma2 family endonuclease